MTARSRFSFARKLPGVDSPRALAAATLFLVGARSLEHVTVEAFANQYRLSAKRAEYMLGQARKRRAADG